MTFALQHVMSCDKCRRKSEPFEPGIGYLAMFDRLDLLGWTFYQTLSGDQLRGNWPSDEPSIKELTVWCPACTDAEDGNEPRATVRLRLSWSSSLNFDGVDVLTRIPRGMTAREILDDLRGDRAVIGEWLELVNAQHTEGELMERQTVEHIELLNIEIVDLDVVGERGNKD
jgi:hypothetical protein